MNPQDILDKVLVIMDKHLDQIRIDATKLTKDGPKGFTPTDSQVAERYAKIILTINKTTTEDDLSALSDDELQALLNESDNDVPDTTGET